MSVSRLIPIGSLVLWAETDEKTLLDRIDKMIENDQYYQGIKEKIESLLDAHYRETFTKWLETERIVCQPSYRLPSVIHPTTSTDIYGGSLYEAEDGDINKLEQDLIMELTALPNVRWWHRNLSRHGFAINGYIKHYPDIMIMTQSGNY